MQKKLKTVDKIKNRAIAFQHTYQILELMGNSNCTFCQIVPSEPPGFGGVERIAHEIANEYHTDIYTFSQTKNKNFSSSRDYSLIKLKSFNIGKIVIPLPTPNILKLIFNTPKTCIFTFHALVRAPHFVFLLLRKTRM